MARESVITTCVALLTLIAVLTVMRLAEGLFAPMVAAIVLGIVCAPATDVIERAGIPRIAAALLVLFTFLTTFTALFFAVEPTISNAIRQAPLIWREMTEILETLKSALSGVREIQETVTGALAEDANTPQQPAEDAPMAFPGVLDALALAPSLAAAIMIFVGTFYFFLVARSDVYDRADRANIRLSRAILCKAEARVSRYFITITVINAIFGALVGVAMTALGVANPMLWGLAAFLVNFVLYLGPVTFALALLVAGIVQFDGAMSFAPAALYITMNMTEGQFVTPSLVGRHMRVNPLLVFVSLVFWLWLWGPIGGVVAIPILVWCLYVASELSNADAPKHVLLREDGRAPQAAE